MQILKVTDEAFRQYGKVIKDLDVSDIITAMSETPCPDCGGDYRPPDPDQRGGK